MNEPHSDPTAPPEDSSDPTPVESEARGFPCEQCGARMRWEPDVDALACEYCGHTCAVPRVAAEIIERPLADAGKAARGYGVELRVSRCGNCGARVTFGDASTSQLCVYCGSANVLEEQASRNAIRPESLVPLDVGREQVAEAFRNWIRSRWFRPNALRKTGRFEATGIYVPFWTFDAAVHSEWSADAGYYYYVTETYTTRVNGKPAVRTRQVRKVRWVPAWGERDDRYDDLLVLASRGLPEPLVEKLGGFDTSGLVPYRPEYLAGWRAEEYQLDLTQGWQRARERIVELQRARCAGDVPGDTHRNLVVRNEIGEVTWKHVLLPLWSVQYRFRGKVYTVLVHGQSGRVVGEAPWSWVKISLTLLVLLAVGALVFGWVVSP